MRERGVREMAAGLWRLCAYVFGRYQADGASRMAASLSYTSLLALVPLIAIGLAILTAFPVFDTVRVQIQEWAFANFVPAVGAQVQDYIERFVANAGRLSAAGIVGLAFTSVMLLVTVEGSLNLVFRVARARSVVSRLLIYWTLLTLGPLVLGAIFSLQGYLTALGRWSGAQPGTLELLATPLPTVLSVLAFAGLFAIVPNRRVRLADAFIGGLAAGLLFAALRYGFGLYVTSSQAYTTVYGAVATIPIFLFWMFLSWAVVLVGAEVAAALPEWRAGLVRSRPGSAGHRLGLALALLAACHEDSKVSGEGVTRRRLHEISATHEAQFLAVLRRLVEAGLLAPTRGRRYLVARDLDSVSLWQLLGALGIELSLDGAGGDVPWRAAAAARLTEASGAAKTVLDVPLKRVLEGA
ncbi:MAG: YihY family inner membrane protein [Actinomycetota bacterium]